MPTKPENHITNYYLLERLGRKLDGLLRGKTLQDCYSTSKDDIVFEFEGTVLKAHFSEQCFVYLPEKQGHRSSDAIPHFRAIIDKTVTACHAHPQDRSFRIRFANGHTLVLMMYGRNGNILLFRENEVVGLFREQFLKHISIALSSFNAFTAPSQETYRQESESNGPMAALKKLFVGFTQRMMHYLVTQGIETKAIDAQWTVIANLEQLLLQGTIDVIQDADRNSWLSLLPDGDDGNQVQSTADVLEALANYSRGYFYASHFKELKGKKLLQLKSKIEKAKKQWEAAETHLNFLENDSNYKNQADIIMANLHQIPVGTEKMTLFDFYQDKEVEIPLKRGSTPQQWAEKLYRKSKSQQIEKDKTREKIAHLENEWLALQEELAHTETIEDVKELKALAKTVKEDAAADAIPFRHYSFEGYDIYVGQKRGEQ